VNGGGLGHLNRALAIARRIARLQPAASIWFLTTSRMLEPVLREGFVPYYIPPRAAYGERISSEQWNRILFAQIRLLVEQHRPSALVYDGVWPYPGLVRSLKAGSFKSATIILRLRHAHARLEDLSGRFTLFDHVIHPGEVGETEAAIPSPAEGLRPHRVAPILYYDPDELLPRSEARRRLALSAEHRVAYVQLGAGNMDDAVSWTGEVLSLLSRYPDIEVVLGESPIANHDLVPRTGVHRIEQYPNAYLFNAFDFAISAAGYNTVHELLFHGVPAILIPMERLTDDQAGRARPAERAGAAMVVTTRAELAAALERMLEADTAARLRASAHRLIPSNGAEAAAQIISGQQCVLA
jgi:UDP:flavonoid glycosyltransferase YjiC (YdhE family)